MARPSPRTQGVDEEGKTFQKFGANIFEVETFDDFVDFPLIFMYFDDFH